MSPSEILMECCADFGETSSAWQRGTPKARVTVNASNINFIQNLSFTTKKFFMPVRFKYRNYLWGGDRTHSLEIRRRTEHAGIEAIIYVKKENETLVAVSPWPSPMPFPISFSSFKYRVSTVGITVKIARFRDRPFRCRIIF